jgi:hypothetical protein
MVGRKIPGDSSEIEILADFSLKPYKGNRVSEKRGLLFLGRIDHSLNEVVIELFAPP